MTTAEKSEELLSNSSGIKKFGFAGWMEKVKDTVLAAGQKVDEPLSDRASEALESLSKAKPGDIQTIAASQMNLLTGHYEMVLKQAEKIFKAAKYALIVGALLFTVATMFMLSYLSPVIVTISFIGAVLVELVAGVNFIFYWKTVSQLKGFHFRFDRIQSYLLANSVCESLDGEAKTTSRQELIRKIAAIDDRRAGEQADESKDAVDTAAENWKY